MRGSDVHTTASQFQRYTAAGATWVVSKPEGLNRRKWLHPRNQVRPEVAGWILRDEWVMNAYRAVRRGREFVRVHRAREDLGLPRGRFDQALGELAAAYAIELDGGDPSRLTADR